METDLRKRILVVDDEPNVAMVLADALVNLSHTYDLVVAETPTLALEKARSQKVDLVITDYKMPGMDGLTLIKLLRQEFPDMAAILMTGHGSEELQQTAAEQRVDQFMSKPFALTDIRQVVRTVLARLDNAVARPMAPTDVSQELVGRLKKLVEDTAVRCAFVTTVDGILIESVGDSWGINLQTIATLMAANFAAMLEIARLLGTPHSFQAVNHESQDINIYACAIGEMYLLVLIYDFSVRAGMARYYARKAIDDLQPLLKTSTEQHLTFANEHLDLALDDALFDLNQSVQFFDPRNEATDAYASSALLTLDEAIQRGIISWKDGKAL